MDGSRDGRDTGLAENFYRYDLFLRRLEYLGSAGSDDEGRCYL